jgi:hypothetical protein
MMSTVDSGSPGQKRQFAVSTLLGLLAWLALIFGFARLTGEMYWTFALAGATVGLFLANHLATTRYQALAYLFAIPNVCLGLATALPTLRNDGLAAGFDQLAGLFLMGCIYGIFPGILAALLIAIVSAVICEFWGIPASKFDFDDSGNDHDSR